MPLFRRNSNASSAASRVASDNNSTFSDAASVSTAGTQTSGRSRKPSWTSRLGSVLSGKKVPLPGTAADPTITSDASATLGSDYEMSGALGGYPPQLSVTDVTDVTDGSLLPAPQQSTPSYQASSISSRPSTPFYPPPPSQSQPGPPSQQTSNIGTPQSSIPETTTPNRPTSQLPTRDNASSYFSSAAAPSDSSYFSRPHIVPRPWRAPPSQTASDTQTQATQAPSTGGHVGVSMMDPDTHGDKAPGLRVRKDRDGRLEISWDLPRDQPHGATTTFKSSHLDPTTGKEVDTFFELSYIPHKEGSNRGTTIVNITDAPGSPTNGAVTGSSGVSGLSSAASYTNTQPTFTGVNGPVSTNSGAPHPPWQSNFMRDLSSIATDGSDAAYASALSEVIRNRDIASQKLDCTGDEATKTGIQWAQARQHGMLESSVFSSVADGTFIPPEDVDSVVSSIMRAVSTDASPARIVIDEDEANDMHLATWLMRDDHGRKVPEREIERRMSILSSNLDDLNENTYCRDAPLMGKLSVAAQTAENRHCNRIKDLDSDNQSRITSCLRGTQARRSNLW